MAEPYHPINKEINPWYIRDKGQLYKFDRMIQTPTGQAKTYLYKKIDIYGAVEKTYSPYGSEIPVLYRYGVKRQKVGEYFITSTVKFSPKDHECYAPDCSYRTCPDFARNDKGSTEEQKLNKRILTRFKIKQIDLEDEMIVKVTKKKIIYKDVGIRFTRVTPLRKYKSTKRFISAILNYPISIPQTVSGLVYPKWKPNRPINEGVRF